MPKLDRNRQLQLSRVIAPVLDRIAYGADVFVETDVFRNTKSENHVARKSLIGWLRKSGMLEDCPEGYRVLKPDDIVSLATLMRSSPFSAMGQYLQFCNRENRDEETEDEGPEQEEISETVRTETIDPEDVQGDPPDEGMGEDPVLDGKPKIRETLLELDKMISEANTKNRARFVLSITALAILLSKVPDGAFLTRKELFKPPGFVHEKCVTNEALAKSWQKTFLDRTEEVGLTEKTISGRDSVYRIADGRTDEVIHMVSDAVHEAGQSLRRILWPGQYGEGEEDESEQAAVDEPAAVDGGAVEVLSELVGQLTAVAESMAKVHQSMESVLTRLSEIGDQSVARESRAEAFLGGIRDSLSSIVSRLNADEKDSLNSIKDRLGEIQTRRKSLSNQLESEVQKEDKLLEELRVGLARVERRAVMESMKGPDVNNR